MASAKFRDEVGTAAETLGGTFFASPTVRDGDYCAEWESLMLQTLEREGAVCGYMSIDLGSERREDGAVICSGWTRVLGIIQAS